MRPFIIVGQAPSRKMEPGARALEGSDTLKRIAKLAGYEPFQILGMFHTRNVITEWLGPDPKNKKYDLFDKEKGKEGAANIASEFPDCTHILLGNHVAKAYTVGSLHWMEEGLSPRLKVRVVKTPHPGGTNQWLNDPDNKQLLARFWRNACLHQASLRGTLDGQLLPSL